MPSHELGSARAVRAAASEKEREEAGRKECQWRRNYYLVKSENWCLTTKSCAKRIVGPYLIAVKFLQTNPFPQT